MRAHGLKSEQEAVDLALRRLDGGSQPVIGVIEEYFRSSNEEDWEAFGRTWTDDAELHAVGGPPATGATTSCAPTGSSSGSSAATRTASSGSS